jgi:CubicO group peptidase (beta-lactamase class C family)
MGRLTLIVCATLLMAVATPGAARTEVAAAPPSEFAALAADLEDLREVLAIPGLSAAVVRDGEIAWEQGFGFANIADAIEADEHTPYGLASVSKPVAAVVVMQLIEKGLVGLDDPVADYGVSLPGYVTVRHLLNHTSEGTPGTVHSYNGNRYGLLGGVIEAATGESFAVHLGERVLAPLAMDDSALNPLNAWNEASIRGLESFAMAIGWGTAFDHYPDVYNRLAHPYQFDTDHSIIPGKYHLIHNPAAGMISSVHDLALFDLALDEGRLLDHTTRNLMFGETVPTRPNQTSQTYGLGWYVQDFEGTQLLWHYGRWPPSTSALYLKVPEHDLTFIALANTDNLTVPFAGVGDGDGMRSAPALSFFRHLVFPDLHGYELPDVDWSQSQEAVAAQIAVTDQPAGLAHLERELWAHRQAYASSGNTSQAAVLRSVASDVFRGSDLTTDPSYTWLPGTPEVVAPLMSARTFSTIAWAVLGWILIAAGSVVAMVWRLSRASQSVWVWVMWLLGAAVLGPLAHLAHTLRRRAGRSDTRAAPAICASVFCVTGYSLAWVVAVAVILSGGDDPNPLLMLVSVVVLPVAVGLLGVRGPLYRGRFGGYWTSVRRGIVTEVMTFSIGLAAMYVVLMYVDTQLLETIPFPTSPFFWALLSAAAVIGFVGLTVLNSLLQRRGFTVWPAEVGSASVVLPTVRDSWWMLAVVVVVAFGAIALAVATLA